MGFHKQASQEQLDSTELPPLGTPEESIPRAIVPWSRDDDRSRYLGLRSSGFTIREALGLIGKAKSTLSLWRKNEKFLELEDRLPELKRELGLEYAALEFLRNYRLVLEKDYRVLRGSLTKRSGQDKDGNKIPVPMDTQDFKYLLQLRSHYTPQQLQAVEQLFGKDKNNGEAMGWTDFVLTLRKTQTEEVKIETRKRQEPELALITERDFEEVELTQKDE